MSEKKSYNYCLDFIKGIACMLVVFIHCQFPGLLGIGVRTIVRFCVPLFFMVSGYFCYNVNSKEHSSKKIKHIASITFYSSLFYLVFAGIRNWLFTAQSYNFAPSRFLIWAVFNSPIIIADQYWFLYALLGLRFLFGDISSLKVMRKFYIVISVVCVLYMTFESDLVSIDTIFRGYLIGRMIPSLIFFCTGFLLLDMNWNPKRVSKLYVIPLTLLFLFLPLFNGNCGIVANDYGRSYPIFVANAIMSSLLLFILSTKIPTTKFTQTISIGTIVVLGTHIPILHILDHLLPNIISFTFPFITIVVCYYIIILCEKYCPILLGKWRNIPFTKECCS